MSMDLLSKVEGAEALAEEQRAAAQREAREILKGVEEATLAAGRAGSLANRDLSAEALAGARAEAQRAIEANRRTEAAERDALRARAVERLPQATTIILERVVDDGHR